MKIELNNNLKWLLVMEEIMMLLLSIILFVLMTDYSMWWYALLFFLPDVSFAAYLINQKTGAQVYNLFHHKGVMILLVIIGYFFTIPLLTAIGIIFFGHSSFDRLFGYGLKFDDSFHNTHLGKIGKKD